MPRVLRRGDTLKVGIFTLTYEERSLSLPLEDMTTIPIPGSVSSNDSLPGVSARNGGMDQLQARDEMLAVPEALPLAPASGGLLHVANTPTMLSPMPGSINGHAGGAGRNLGRVTPVPDSLQKPAGRTGVSSTPLTPLPS